MGASMSAVTPISQNPGDLGTEYIGISPPAVGAKVGAAASASHVHRVLASSSQIIGFGRMAKVTWPPPAPSGPCAVAYLYSQLPQTVPAEWTAECWLSAPDNPPNYGFGFGGFGWSDANGPLPYDGVNEAHFMGFSYGGSSPGVWGGGFGTPAGLGPPSPIPVAAAQHYMVQMDSQGRIWLGLAGALYGPYTPPAGSVIYTQGFPYLRFVGNYGTPPITCEVDEVRFSSVLRYPTSGATYQVPAAAFDPDADTFLLWHLDDIPYGGFLTSNGNGGGVFVPSTITTADATINGRTGIFAFNDVTAQTTGLPYPPIWAGMNSNVAPGSGSGAAQTVESVQGQTGNFLLVDSGGNVIPVASPNGAQLIQVVSHLIGSPEYWLERIY